MQVPMKNMAGETVGQVELSEVVFAAPVNKSLMHQALLRQLANARLGTHKVKGRSEVSGGGRKPWKQKGTGRARQGSTRAAQFRGGGIIFGPTPRSYEQRMPRKMRQAAIRAALTEKLANERLVVLDELAVATPKTKEMAQVLQNVAVDAGTCLIVLAQGDENIERSANNLPAVKLLRAHYLNVRDLLNYDYLLIPRDSLAIIEQLWGIREEVA